MLQQQDPDNQAPKANVPAMRFPGTARMDASRILSDDEDQQHAIHGARPTIHSDVPVFYCWITFTV